MLKERIISIFLAMCLCLSFATSAMAAKDGVPFSDVSQSKWYYDSVKFVYDNGFMNGTNGSTFSPDTTTTRGMLVTILHRMAGKPYARSAEFEDVAAGEYYANAVAWANANKIVSGYGNGKFGPNDLITREQIVTILYRFAKANRVDVSGQKSLAGFSDNKEISTYAKDAMSWAYAVGLINGVGSGKIAPKATATRAQMAAFVMRMAEYIKNPIKPEKTAYEAYYDFIESKAWADDAVKVRGITTASEKLNYKQSLGGWYSVYDVDKNGTDELILLVGPAVAGGVCLVYTVSNGKVICTGGESVSTLCRPMGNANKNDIILYEYHGGLEWFTKLELKSGKTITTESGEWMGTNGYYGIEQYYLDEANRLLNGTADNNYKEPEEMITVTMKIQGYTVRMQVPQLWIDKCYIESSDYSVWVTEKATYESGKNGGHVFSVVFTDFQTESENYYPESRVIGRWEKGLIVLVFPSDVQWVENDSVLRQGYLDVNEWRSDVVASITITK